MARKKSSGMTKVLLGLVILALIGGGYFLTHIGFEGNDGKRHVIDYDFDSRRLKTVTVDADIAVDTLNTIVTDNVDLKDKYQGVEEDLSAQAKSMRELTDTLQSLNETNKQLKAELDQQRRKMEAMTQVVHQNKTVDIASLKDEISQNIKDNFGSYIPKDIQEQFDNNKNAEAYPVEAMKEKPLQRVRVRSYGLPMDKNGQVSEAYLNSLNSKGDETAGSLEQRGSNQPSSETTFKKSSVVVDPRFTIPPDAVLNDSVTISALVGRIPREGDVQDPAPFKVAIGKENLAANGFRIPGLDGMIMSGEAYGDAVRKCVYSRIKRATYIFEDGSILTLPNAKRANSGTLGYLSDEYGDPCIKGRYYSNARKQQAKSLLANMAATGANAYASTQTTSTTNSAGGSSTVVDGSKEKFITGSIIAAGAQGIANEILKERFDSWDQVVVPAGQTVSININTALEIDHASNLRKISYENHNTTYGLTD